MTDETPCAVRMANRARGTHRRPHLGQHLCVADTGHPGWHRCWCGYQWGATTGEP